MIGVRFDTVTGEMVEVELAQEEIDELASFMFPGEKTYRIGKSTPWRRMTDNEAETAAATIKQQPVRIQMIYDAAAYIDTGDPLFETLKQLLTALFGEERADELLAPEDVS